MCVCVWGGGGGDTCLTPLESFDHVNYSLGIFFYPHTTAPCRYIRLLGLLATATSVLAAGAGV